MVAYGVLMLAGGAMGYATARSLKSLIAGVVSAVLIGIAYYLSREHPRLGFGIGAAVSAGLILVFVIRVQEILAQTPAKSVASNIGLASLSGIVALYLLYALTQSRA